MFLNAGVSSWSSMTVECEASMWLLADGPVSLSDGACAFLGNGPSLFWLGKSKPFMLWSGKNETRVCSTRGYLFVCRGKKGKPTAVCTPVRRLWVRMRHIIPVNFICLSW